MLVRWLSGWYRFLTARISPGCMMFSMPSSAGAAIWFAFGQEFNSFRRSTRSKGLRDFQLHRQEKFLYVCDVMDLWEWDVRVLDIQQGIEDDHTPLCLGGRGAPPPEYCGGPRGYRLMLKRQQEGGTIADSASVEDGPKTFRPMTHWLRGRTSPELQIHLTSKPLGTEAVLVSDLIG